MKFSKKLFPPSFFDLTQNISRDLPIDVIAEWTEGNQSEGAARRILKKTKVTGTLVSSDSCGLTKMSLHSGLIEMLAKINKPKELVFSYGTHIGGQGIGIWAADNTEMFYRDHIAPGEISSMLIALQDHIKRECEVQIGLGAHHGEFYYLGGGLYGTQADWIEDVVENSTGPTDIVMTGQFLKRLPHDHEFVFTEREDLRSGMGSVFQLSGGPPLVGEPRAETLYPIPYSKTFYDELIVYEKSTDQSLLTSMYSRYAKKAVVVLVEREREDAPSREMRLLNDLALAVVMKKTAQDLLTEHAGEEIKTTGNLGIYTFGTCSNALPFAKAFRSALQYDGLQSKIGVDCGEVLVFETPDGHKDIAGMPVNCASKMAQDKGEFGNIYLSADIAQTVDASGFSPVLFEVSGVVLEAFVG